MIHFLIKDFTFYSHLIHFKILKLKALNSHFLIYLPLLNPQPFQLLDYSMHILEII